MTSAVLILVGIVLLLGGAEMLVRGAVALADRIGVSKLLIGMTVVAFGTSAPEFVVSLNAALNGAPGITMGNVVGSNIANVLLVLGGVALVRPIIMQRSALMRDMLVMIMGSLLFAGLCWRGGYSWVGGGVMFGALIAYFVYSYIQEARDKDSAGDMHIHEAEEFEDIDLTAWKAWAFFLGGLVGVVFGADLLVQGATEVARQFGISEAVIGLTLIALGTSLPELATSVVAAVRGHSDVAIGNVIGSNLLNLLGVAGLVGIITPLDVPAQIQNFDLWIMLGASVLVMVYVLAGRALKRPDGLVFVGGYVAYIAVQAYGVEAMMGSFSMTQLIQ